MSDPRDQLPADDRSSTLRDSRARRTLVQRMSDFSSGAVGAWFVLFVALLFGAAGGFEADRPWWGIPLIGAIAVACALVALRFRRHKPEISAGIWTGLGIGLLNAGLCFAM